MNSFCKEAEADYCPSCSRACLEEEPQSNVSDRGDPEERKQSQGTKQREGLRSWVMAKSEKALGCGQNRGARRGGSPNLQSRTVFMSQMMSPFSYEYTSFDEQEQILVRVVLLNR